MTEQSIRVLVLDDLPEELADLGLRPEDVFLKPITDMGEVAQAIHQQMGR